MIKQNLVIICLLGALTILLGAFGVHSLEESLTSQELKSFETAVKYQMYHVIVLLFVNTTSKFSDRSKKLITHILFAGIICFAGSIYAITFGADASYIWFVTPIGGLLFVVGWLKMALELYKKSEV